MKAEFLPEWRKLEGSGMTALQRWNKKRTAGLGFCNQWKDTLEMKTFQAGKYWENSLPPGWNWRNFKTSSSDGEKIMSAEAWKCHRERKLWVEKVSTWENVNRFLWCEAATVVGSGVYNIHYVYMQRNKKQKAAEVNGEESPPPPPAEQELSTVPVHPELLPVSQEWCWISHVIAPNKKRMDD